MSFFNPVLAPVAAKVHQCIACLASIPKGEQHKYLTGHYDGEWFRIRYHNECWDTLHEDPYAEEFTPGCCEPPTRLTEASGEVMDAIRASTKWTQDQADAIAAKVRRQIS